MTASTEVIWEECSLHLRRFILGRVHLEQDAEDVLQDVFVKIHNNLHSLKDEDKLEAWIFQIARNAIVDYYRLTKHTAVDISEYPDRWAEEGLEDDSEGPRGESLHAFGLW